MVLIRGHRDRGLTRDITVLDVDGNSIVLGTADKIRAIIGRQGRLGVGLADAQLVVTSDAPTANGSTFVKNSPTSGENRLRLDNEDLVGIQAGTYSLIIDMFDNSDTQEWKTVDRQVFVLEET